MEDFEGIIASQPITDDPRSEARLCAVQAVFQIRLTEDTFGNVLAQFHNGTVASRKADVKLFNKLVEEVATNIKRYSDLISTYLKETWTFDRLDSTMQALLLVGVTELSNYPNTPLKVIATEYLTITRVFFDESQVKFVNGLLNSVAKAVREEV